MKKGSMYKPNDTCAECGGHCCKQIPGIVFPSDLGDNKEEVVAKVKELMETGNYVFDYWEGKIPSQQPGDNRTAYFLRPRTVREVPFTKVNGSWGAACNFLTDTGCSLKHEDKPFGCRALEPKASLDEECMGEPEHDKPGACIEWLEYNEEIEELLEGEERTKDSPAGGLFEFLGLF